MILDGHEVSDTEKVFLMNWKAMRKARRKQRQQSLEQLIAVPAAAPAILPSAPPLTLPALPARQLPHRCKKRRHYIHESAPFSYVHNQLPQLISEEIEVTEPDTKKDFKLPELAPYQSVLTQKEHLLSNHLPEKTIMEIY